MEILKIQQGSDEWKAIRTQYLVASEAPVIMGASPYIKRDELLRLKSTGNEIEVSDWVKEFIFKPGHEVEALARTIAEQEGRLIGEGLYPDTVINEVSELNLLASLDGLTMAMDKSWEHKQFNRELFALVQSGGELEGKHFWQLEHQMMVLGTDSCVFSCSDGTEENYAEMVYHSRPERREQLIHGWKLFLEDLEKYEYVPETVKAEGEKPRKLPALNIQISGEVKSSNLATYQDIALSWIRNTKTELKTDQDFANAKEIVKFCGDAEKELEIVKYQTLGQVESINEVVRTIDLIKAEMRSTRLMLDKLVKTEEEARRAEIIAAAKEVWLDYIGDVNQTLKRVSLPPIQIDLPGAIKGRRNIDTIRAAANDEVARAKIEAARMQTLILGNISILDQIDGNYDSLFPDLQQLVIKDKDAFEAICKQRIAEHKAAEEKRIQEEAQRIADQKERERLAEEKRVADEKASAELAAQQAVDVKRTPDEPTLTSSLDSELVDAELVEPIVGGADNSRSIKSGSIAKYYSLSTPTQDEIIKVLANHYRTNERTIAKWLNEMFMSSPQAKSEIGAREQQKAVND